MIPKIIHYCWFGGHAKTELAKFCIESWKKVQPDFEIKEWNEDNSDLTGNAYVREAFEEGKWAFVSDYVRSKVMHDHGGFYMDTDMELKMPLNDFLDEEAICAFELKGVPYSAFWAAVPEHQLAKDFLEYYNNQEGFVEEINTKVFSDLLKEKYGADIERDEKQQLKHNVTLYPSQYFSQDLPRNYVAHHFSGSWFGGDEESTHKKMVNMYGVLKQLTEQPNPKKYVDRVINKHHLFTAKEILDCFPREVIEDYLKE
ncbi:MAG: glycosyl transferase [Chryseobacterium sp.]|nr:MAG: glycosyl transferase [Chryseobacterium sp.]